MKGLTLVELLMTLIIVSIVMVSIYNVLQHSISSFSHVEARAEITQNARMAIERFSKEVRQACNFRDPCDVNAIQFGIDQNGDGDDGDNEDKRIRYRLSGSDLERRERVSGNWQDWEVIANYVTSFTLSYRDEDNNLFIVLPLPDQDARDAIRLISVDIALQKMRKGGDDLFPVELRATMHPRNR